MLAQAAQHPAKPGQTCTPPSAVFRLLGSGAWRTRGTMLAPRPMLTRCPGAEQEPWRAAEEPPAVSQRALVAGRGLLAPA